MLRALATLSVGVLGCVGCFASDIANPNDISQLGGLDAGPPDAETPDADLSPDADLRPACVEGDFRATDPETGNCYWVSWTTTQDWVTSKQTCMEAGGYLAVITSAEENTRVTGLAAQAHQASLDAVGGDTTQDVADYWIGLTDAAVENTFVWDATGEPLTFDGWRKDPLEPNNGGVAGEDCAIIEGDTELLTWDDRACANDDGLGIVVNYGFICER